MSSLWCSWVLSCLNVGLLRTNPVNYKNWRKLQKSLKKKHRYCDEKKWCAGATTQLKKFNLLSQSFLKYLFSFWNHRIICIRYHLNDSGVNFNFRWNFPPKIITKHLIWFKHSTEEWNVNNCAFLMASNGVRMKLKAQKVLYNHGLPVNMPPTMAMVRVIRIAKSWKAACFSDDLPKP